MLLNGLSALDGVTLVPSKKYDRSGYEAQEVACLNDTSKYSVYRTIVNLEKTGSIGPKPRRGRRPKANKRLIQNLLRMAFICPRLSARELKNDWTDGYLYTVDGVREVLNKNGLNRRVAPKKFKVTTRHRLLGQKWCSQIGALQLVSSHSTDEQINL